MELTFLEEAAHNQKCAKDIIAETDIIKTWQSVKAEPRLVGSLAMGLLMKHLDIDFHIYSSPLLIEDCFTAMGKLAKNPRIKKIECQNLLNTQEECVEWHALYEDEQQRIWQIDMIHILKGSLYDGYFERMAERIKSTLTDDTRQTILKLKYLTPETEHIKGIEYYQAVLRDGITDFNEFMKWRKANPVSGIVEWMP